MCGAAVAEELIKVLRSPSPVGLSRVVAVPEGISSDTEGAASVELEAGVVVVAASVGWFPLQGPTISQ